MSSEDKLGLTMMMELIEGELEERKISFDRRKQNSEADMKKQTEKDRRVTPDRRSASS